MEYHSTWEVVMDEKVLVFGATGQQGGSVVDALLKDGVLIRAFVRNPEKGEELLKKDGYVELAIGDLRDRESIRRALVGIDSVFCALPSSAQPQYGISDEDEVAIGQVMIDEAANAGVKRFVFSSVAGVGASTGLAHLDTKWRIETHLRDSGLDYAIIRPNGFMENLEWPVFGLRDGTFRYFVKPDLPVQLIAVEDIGKIVALAFRDWPNFSRTALEIAGDESTGNELGELFSARSGQAIRYEQFSGDDPFFGPIVAFFNLHGGGSADIAALKKRLPELKSVAQWLETRTI